MLPPDQSLQAAVKSLLETAHSSFINTSAPCRLEDDRTPRQRPMWVLKTDAGSDRHPQIKSMTLTVEHRVTDETDLTTAGQQVRAVFETLQLSSTFVSLRAVMANDQCILSFFNPRSPTSAAEGENGRCFTIEVLCEVWQVPQS